MPRRKPDGEFSPSNYEPYLRLCATLHVRPCTLVKSKQLLWYTQLSVGTLTLCRRYCEPLRYIRCNNVNVCHGASTSPEIQTRRLLQPASLPPSQPRVATPVTRAINLRATLSPYVESFTIEINPPSRRILPLALTGRKARRIRLGKWVSSCEMC